MPEGITPLSFVMSIAINPGDSLSQRWGNKIANLAYLIGTIGPITPNAIAVDKYESQKAIMALKQINEGITSTTYWDEFFEQVTDLLIGARVSFPAILRSSLIAEGEYLSSWSGIASSKLINSVNELPAAILSIDASLSTNIYRDYQSQLLSYSRQKIDNGLALLLQTYTPSRWSGVALTDGRGMNKGDFVIDISDKGNEAVTAGQLPSIQLALNKSNGSLSYLNGILDIEDTVTETIFGLFELGLQIETLFGKPQCIEWGADKNGNLMIFQSHSYRGMD